MAGPLGIICALPEEIEHLHAALTNRDEETVGGFHFARGRLDGEPVVLVESGIGKVASSLTATLLCAQFRCRCLLFSGVAGGLDPALGVGDVVIGERLIQHDYGALHDSGLVSYRAGTIPIGERRAPLAFETDAGLVSRARGALASLSLPVLPAAATGEAPPPPQVHFGPIVSGGQFINNGTARRRRFAAFGGPAVAMEGGATAPVTHGV